MFKEKCRSRKIKPDIPGLTSGKLREWNRNVWQDRLVPMMKELPDFDIVWKEWTKTFKQMTGKKR